MIRTLTSFYKTTRALIATLALAALALAMPAAPTVHAMGLRNCADLTGSDVGRVACYEMVWANGVQVTMTFSNLNFPPTTGAPMGNFYVLAPQTDTLQGWVPFPHDHVIGDVPSHNHGDYTVHYHGYFVFCSADGIASGACVPAMIQIPGFGTVPFARTVNGQMLTSSQSIEAAASAGLLTLIDTGGFLVGTVNANT